VTAFEMGGTTVKACLFQGCRPDVAPAWRPRAPTASSGRRDPGEASLIDMIEIGAGGGSIARVDALGLLKLHVLAASPAPPVPSRLPLA
jgi:N-methylhydantoinase A/oxoprolinase/acetone carboxylase beta subunit